MANEEFLKQAETAEVPEAEAPADEVKAEGGQFSPEEAKAIEGALDTASKLLYTKAVAEMIRRPPHPKAIGDATALLMVQTDKQLGGIQDDLIFKTAIMLAGLVTDLGVELDFYEPDENFEVQTKAATLVAVAREFKVDPEVLKAALAEIDPGAVQDAMAHPQPTPGAPAQPAPQQTQASPEAVNVQE